MENLAAQATELVVAFALVLLCFVAFLGVLGLSFPDGTSLKDLMGYSDRAAAPGGPALAVDLGPATERRLPLIASLTHVFRRVTDRPPDAVAWTESRVGEALRDRHAIQTFAKSGATILFGGDDDLQLSENSLIILKRVEQEPEARTKHAVVLLLEGELSARIAPGRRERVEVGIETGQGEFHIGASAARPADFKLTVAGDESSTLAVYAGQASVTAQGQTVVVAPNHAVTVLPGQAPGTPVRLAARPVAGVPQDGAVQRFRTEATDVHFDWEDQDDAERYRFVLARDPDFAEIVHDERLDASGFTHGHLRDGTYYWKVSALRGGLEGPPTPRRHLVLIQDRQAPTLRVDAPPAIVETPTLLLRGATEPGCRVLIGEREAPTAPDGTFEVELPLDPGLNVIVIEALDPAGNIAYDSLLVTAKYPENRP